MGTVLVTNLLLSKEKLQHEAQEFWVLSLKQRETGAGGGGGTTTRSFPLQIARSAERKLESTSGGFTFVSVANLNS